MNIKRCARCGCFFISENEVCPNCEIKDKHEINKLNSYLEEHTCISNVHELSANTNITTQNINRFIKNDSLKDFKKFSL